MLKKLFMAAGLAAAFSLSASVAEADHDFDYGFGVTCKEARWIVIELGYRDVRTADCGGRYHTFIARKRGVVFRIKVYARSGRILSVRAI
jgi:hypothetical protein